MMILQQASGDHETLLNLTEAWHRAYCWANDINYQVIRGRVQTERNPAWDKIVLINDFLKNPHIGEIIWLDADTLIADISSNLEAPFFAFGDKSIGMCRHPAAYGNPEHFNTGVMFIKNTLDSVRFFQGVWDLGPVENPWNEQVRVNEMAIKYPEFIYTLDNRWNATDNITEVEDPIIRAWHGKGYLITQCVMKEAMYHYNRLKKLDLL